MKQKVERIEFDISWSFLLKILGLTVAVWVIVVLRDVWFMLTGVFLFVAVVNPIIKRWQKYMSRVLALTLFYVLMMAFFVILFSVFAPVLVNQIKEVSHLLPSLVAKIQPYLQSQFSGPYSGIPDQIISTVQNGVQNLSNSLLSTTISAAGTLAIILTGVVVSFYLLLGEQNTREFLYQVLPHSRFEAVYNTARKISERMGSWVRGQISLMVIIGLSNLVGYLLLRVPSPLPLALWTGICEVIPFVGPTLGYIPAVLVALANGNILQAVLVVVVAYFIIQQIEANVLVPRLMGKAVGLSPVLVILALLIGAQLFGVVGALVSVPVAGAVSVVVEEWPQLRKIWETSV